MEFTYVLYFAAGAACGCLVGFIITFLMIGDRL